MACSDFVGAFVARAALVRFGARDRDAYAGRWTAPDPTLFAGGKANLYVYLGDDVSVRSTAWLDA